MDTAQMTSLVATGRATPLTAGPGSPICYEDRYWLRDGTRFVRVDDADLDVRLRRDHERMRLADAAVDQLDEDSRDRT